MSEPAPPPFDPRPSAGRYQDPLDLIWTRVAQRCGLRLERSAEVFASWDGKDTLHLARADDFDPDDSLAQLVLHELCHALVEGPAALRRPDWGLCNRSERDIVREHACHRVQAALSTPHGLRLLLAPTTEHRVYFDALPQDPLASPDDNDCEPDPALPAAREGHARALHGPWADALREGLELSAQLLAVVGPVAPEGSLWRVAWEQAEG
ncbi:MAG: hypothetical protein DHS20C15_15700 [Planctomycetota bacterium]|nr:MAG: hypothetical protein DHS20C15_15700 [Planctomycetota bacterium]